MRKLTFKGFLAKYVKELSFADTLDLSVLAKEAITENYRLRAPLLLYAVTQGKVQTLKSNLAANSASDDVMNMLSELEASPLEELLEVGSLPEDCCKVWNSFKVRRDRPKHEDELKAAMRTKILQMQQQNKCSTYKLYKDLKLNPGNINCWLKNGDNNKVSYHTAERIVAYMMQL